MPQDDEFVAKKVTREVPPGGPLARAKGPLPDYENPPVNEVVIGLAFQPLAAFKATHFGLLWERLKSEYPTVEHAPPIGLEQMLADPKIAGWPLPRVWFINSSEDRLVQVQTDRLYVNWRARRNGERYPRYAAMLQMYETQYAAFAEFVRQEAIGEIVPLHYELKYVNHIPRGDAWATAEDISKLLPDFSWRSHEDRFLPHPDGGNWSAVFRIPDDMGILTVRITPKARAAKDVQEQLIIMELTATGPADGKGTPQEWFNVAREWIVRAFADLTSLDVQRTVWKRTNGEA